MTEPINEREVNRAAQLIVDAYGANAVMHARELEQASPGNGFAKEVRVKVEAMMRPAEKK